MKVTEYRDDLPSPKVDALIAVRRFALNESGRDFVVGDVHGMFGHLRALLDEVGFDEERDRLFSVGDLVDRGPGSSEALEWLDRPWFHACRGNHEQFAIDSEDPEQLDVWVNYNGGEWWLDLDDRGRPRGLPHPRFCALPMAMEVETRWGRVGIVHADVPPLLPWERFMDRSSRPGHQRRGALRHVVEEPHLGNVHEQLPGRPASVQRVYCGHTPTRETVQPRQRLLHRYRRGLQSTMATRRRVSHWWRSSRSCHQEYAINTHARQSEHANGGRAPIARSTALLKRAGLTPFARSAYAVGDAPPW